MTYTTQSQLLDRYGDRMLIGLTDRAYPATGVVNAATMIRALADTDAMIDGYLAARYALPLASTPTMIVDIAEMIAIWKLHTAAPDPKIEADYKGALSTLRDIAKGDIRLSVAGVEVAQPTTAGVQIVDRARPFTEENMTGFI
jgi:phage gp36-like protein